MLWVLAVDKGFNPTTKSKSFFLVLLLEVTFVLAVISMLEFLLDIAEWLYVLPAN